MEEETLRQLIKDLSDKKKEDEESGKKSEMQRHPDFLPEYREKLMEHNAHRPAATNALLFSHEKLSEGSESTAGKSLLEMTPQTQLYEEIQRALFNIHAKLSKKKSRKMDKEILRLLNDVSNMLDQGGHDDENEGTNSEDTNEGMNTTLVKSDNKPAADPSSTDSMSRLGPYSLQDDLDYDEMSDEEMPDEETSVDKKMAYEAKKFADYRRSWEAIWSETCGSFEHMTALSSMQFTCYAPKHRPLNVSTPETLQIFSIKLAEISGGLEWPLSVYGVVAVRDVVDHNRNYLFYCDRNNSQALTKNDPFLRLIGPSRAVVHEDTVNFEVQLRVKGTTMSQDKALITEGSKCRKIFDNGASTVCIENCFCKVELCVQMVRRTTQATILGVQVVNPTQWPFKYGGRVTCSSLPGKIHVTEDKQVTFVTYPASGELVMVDSKDGTKLKGGDGYLHLSRNVVSVEDQGRLDVGIQTYSKSGGIAAQRLVSFPAEYSKITMKECFFGHVKVVITIAWSLVATDKLDVMSDGALVQACGS